MAVTAEDIKMRIVAENAADKAVKQFARSIKNVDKNVGVLSGNLKALGGIAVGAFAVQGIRKVNDFLQDSVRLAQIQQDAEHKLATSIGYHSQALLDQASALQQATTYGDEAIIQQQAYLAAIGMTERQIREMIPAALDLATGANMSLESATKNLAKTYSGLTGELGESVGQLKTLSKEQLQAGEGVKLVAQIFQGQASSAAETYSGRLEQLSNKYGDLKEDVAEAILDSGAFEAALDSLNPAVDELTQYIVDHKDEIGEFAVGLVGMAVGAGKGAMKIADELTPALETLGGMIQWVTDKASDIPGGWETLLGLAIGSRFGPVGAAIGSSTGFIAGMLFDLARENEYVLGMKSNLYTPPGEDPEFRPLRPGELPYLLSEDEADMMIAYATPYTGKKTGGGSSNNAATTRAQKEKETARKRWNQLLQQTIEWNKKETESIEGLYEADQKRQKTLYNLAILRNADIISLTEYEERVIEAEQALELFKATQDAVLMSDIGKMIEENADIFGDFSDEVQDESDDIVQAVEGIASALSGLTDSGIEGLNYLTAAVQAFSKSGSELEGALNVVGFVGANIGGSTGATISAAASGALAGSALGPVGAAVGGVVGLVSGLFGGDDEEKRRREQERLERERRIKEQRRLVNEEIDETIAAITSPKHLRELDAIRKKYEEYYDVLGGTRLLRDEMLTEMSGSVFGLTGDNLTTMLDAVFKEAGDETEAGRIFADKIEDQLLEGLRDMALSKAIEESLMPMMQPILNEIVYGAMTGTMSPGEMADLALQAKEVADYIAPVVADIYSAFDDAGLRSIEGRADGGPVIADRPYFVGERGIPELFVPSSNGTIVPGDQLTGGRPIQVVVQVGSEVLETIIQDVADSRVVRAERRRGIVFADRNI